MILSIVIIILTIIAWKRGWKWQSLFPWVFFTFIGLIIAFLGPGTEKAATLTKAVTEVLLLIVLIIMCAKGKKRLNS